MTRITFIHPKNRIESIEANDDISVMHEALRHGVRGIVAECGETRFAPPVTSMWTRTGWRNSGQSGRTRTFLWMKLLPGGCQTAACAAKSGLRHT